MNNIIDIEDAKAGGWITEILICPRCGKSDVLVSPVVYDSHVWVEPDICSACDSIIGSGFYTNAGGLPCSSQNELQETLEIINNKENL